MKSLGSGVGQMVSVLALYSVDPSSNPAEVNRFNSLNCLKCTKINKKRPGWPIFKMKSLTKLNLLFWQFDFAQKLRVADNYIVFHFYVVFTTDCDFMRSSKRSKCCKI